MSSSNDFQERVFPADRKKLDGFKLSETVTPQDTHQHSEAKSSFYIRKSLAWDSAFFSSPGVLEPEELLQTNGAARNVVNLLRNEEEILLPSDSMEPAARTRKFDSSSFRKSLAWDNAFYTSPGVLDSEELSIVNKGFRKSKSHQFPDVEEVWRSTESKSTIDSCRSALESLEFELLQDSRLTMQKAACPKPKTRRNLLNFHGSIGNDASSQVRTKASDSQRKDFVSINKQLAAGSGKSIRTSARKFSCLNPSATVATKIVAKAAPGLCPTLTKKPFLRASSSIMPHSSTPASKSSSLRPPMNSTSKLDHSLEDCCQWLKVLNISNPSLDGWSSESSSSFTSDGSITAAQTPSRVDASPASDVKPSCLRVPSPKNGFFDEEIALLRGRGNKLNSIVPSTVAQNGGANRYGKLKPPRTFEGKRNAQKALNGMNKEITKENQGPNTHFHSCIGAVDNTNSLKNQIKGITEKVDSIHLGFDVLLDLKAN